jgi:predicted AAA+ superfamily ATPase
LLGECCVAWLLLMVEEVLRDRGSKLFVKSFREDSKVTIVRIGGNSSGRFSEVAVYDVGGLRGMVVFPEGCAKRGWGCVSGELSKVLIFFGSMMVSSSSSGALAGKILGKVASVLSFAEVVRLPTPVVVDKP